MIAQFVPGADRLSRRGIATHTGKPYEKTLRAQLGSQPDQRWVQSVVRLGTLLLIGDN